MATQIDCDTPSFIPKGLFIHPKDQILGAVRGLITFDPARVTLYLDEAQRRGRPFGTTLAKRLAGKPLLPAQVLNHLLAHPELIPDAWKRIPCIYFWGTVYRDVDDGLCVRCLSWDVREWGSGLRSLSREFDSSRPAALLER